MLTRLATFVPDPASDTHRELPRVTVRRGEEQQDGLGVGGHARRLPPTMLPTPSALTARQPLPLSMPRPPRSKPMAKPMPA